MIKGIGTDITDISRIEKSIASKKFLDKVFTPKEQSFLKKAESFAGNFAAKEAVSKALGTGFKGFYPSCIEILRDENSKPYVLLSGKAKQRADFLGITVIHVSISHEKNTALAFAAAEGI